jgi:hypothetical protein
MPLVEQAQMAVTKSSSCVAPVLQVVDWQWLMLATKA